MNTDKCNNKQNGSTTIVFVMLIMSFVIFSYQAYDLSKAYLTSVVALNVSEQVADLYLVGDNETQNKSKMVTKLSNYSGIQFSSIDNDISYLSEENTSHNGYFLSQVDADTKITPELTKEVSGNKEIYNSTSIQRTKKFSDLNVVLVISDSAGAKSIVSKYEEPLRSALSRLMDSTSSNLSIIPFGYRVNTNGRCYSVIQRGDGFEFPWWEDYFEKYTLVENINNQLSSNNEELTSVQDSISEIKNTIDETNEQIDSEKDVAIKDELEDSLDELEDQLKELRKSKNALQDSIDELEDELAKPNKQLEKLQDTTTYKDYIDLANHYLKSEYGGDDYFLLDNFKDSFLSENDFFFKKKDALASVVDLTDVTSFYEESVKYDSFFSDEGTCPTAPMLLNQTDMNAYDDTFDEMQSNAQYISLIQGLTLGMKTAFSSPENRSVVIYLIDQNDDYLTKQDEQNKTKTIANLACQKSRDSYIDGVAVKNVFLTTTTSGQNHIEDLECTSNSLLNGEINIVNASDYASSEKLSDRILYELLQEGSSSIINSN